MRRPQSDIQRILGYTRKGCRLKKIGGEKKVSKEKYKKYIIEMLDKIESESALERIYSVAHRYFIRRL